MEKVPSIVLGGILLTLIFPLGFPANHAASPQTFTRVGSLTLRPSEGAPSSSIVDPTTGFAYFGIDAPGSLTGGIIVKVRVSDLSRVGTIILNPGEDYPSIALIDTATGFAYFGVVTSGVYLQPGIIVKIRLSDFTRNATLFLPRGLDHLSSAVIDPATGFAYFGTETAPAVVVKIRLSDFTVNDTLVLGNEVNLSTAVIDPSRGFAYFGTYSSPTSDVVRIRLSDLTLNATLTLLSGEFLLRSSIIDPVAGYVYFGTEDTPFPGMIVKIRLSDFREVQGLPMKTGENVVGPAAIDPTAGFAYFGAGCWQSCATQGLVAKVRLSDLTRVANLTLGAGWALSSITIDPAGFAYLGTGNFTVTAFTPGVVEKVRLSDFAVIDAVSLYVGDNQLKSSVIDRAAGFAYFGTDTTPGLIVKIRLSDFTRVGSITLSSGENLLESATIDPAAGFAYFGTSCYYLCASAVSILRVRLSDFTLNATMTLNSSEGRLTTAAIDPTTGYAYFGTDAAVVIKLRLSDFARAGILTLKTDEGAVTTSVIDTNAGFLYLGASSQITPGVNEKGAIVAKIRLSDFTEVGSTIPLQYNSYFSTSVIDEAMGFAYFGTSCAGPYCFGSSYPIVKVKLSDLTTAGTLTLQNQVYPHLVATTAVIDPEAGFAYFLTTGYPADIVKIRLLDFTLNATVALNTGENDVETSIIDSTSGFVYLGTGSSPGVVVKVQIATPPPTTFDFSLSATGGITIQQGGSASETVTATLTGAPSQEVYLSCVAPTLPAETACSFAPNFVIPSVGGTDSLLTISTASSTPLGLFQVQVTGRPLGATTQSTTFSLRVTTPPFRLIAVSPAITVQQGSLETSTLTLTPLNGFSGTVNLTLSAPSALTCSLDHSTIESSGSQSNLSLTCRGNTTGVYTVTIIASSGTFNTQTTTTINVIAASPSRTPPHPSTILGLAPIVFYAIEGAVIVLLSVGGAALLQRSRRNSNSERRTPSRLKP